MKKTIFEGAATALITPMKNGYIDYEAFDNIIRKQILLGIDALVVCGTTGEAATMTAKEHIETIAHAVKTVAGRVPVIAGTGSNNTAKAIETSRAAIDAGADALLVVTPFYNKTSQRGLVNMYTKIADAVTKPMILYNVPSRTGVNIEPQTYKILADHENIVGIKEASGNFSQMAETMALVGDKLDLYSGNDDQIIPVMSLGGKGVISVLSNVLPAETSKLCHLFLDGKLKESRELQMKYLPLIHALFSDVNPIPVKEAMAMLGYCLPDMREPLFPMEYQKREALRGRLAEAGLRPEFA